MVSTKSKEISCKEREIAAKEKTETARAHVQKTCDFGKRAGTKTKRNKFNRQKWTDWKYFLQLGIPPSVIRILMSSYMLFEKDFFPLIKILFRSPWVLCVWVDGSFGRWASFFCAFFLFYFFYFLFCEIVELRIFIWFPLGLPGMVRKESFVEFLH